MDTAQLAKISKALADPTRLGVYEAIAAQPELVCGEILGKCPLAPGTLSHHLRVLVEAGLVACRRKGQFIHSRALPDTMRDYTQALSRLAHSAQPGRPKSRRNRGKSGS
jgi:ArsR family transcriptional regulator, arsenate/arsenite/antimonite-responsive transcriptional repressor